MAGNGMRALLLLVLVRLIQALSPLPAPAGSRVPMKYFDARPMRYAQIFGTKARAARRDIAR
jgi:hypothetical protein